VPVVVVVGACVVVVDAWGTVVVGAAVTDCVVVGAVVARGAAVLVRAAPWSSIVATGGGSSGKVSVTIEVRGGAVVPGGFVPFAAVVAGPAAAHAG